MKITLFLILFTSMSFASDSSLLPVGVSKNIKQLDQNIPYENVSGECHLNLYPEGGLDQKIPFSFSFDLRGTNFVRVPFEINGQKLTLYFVYLLKGTYRMLDDPAALETAWFYIRNNDTGLLESRGASFSAREKAEIPLNLVIRNEYYINGEFVINRVLCKIKKTPRSLTL